VKRTVVSLWLAAVGLMAACTDPQDTIPRAELAGTFDMALVGKLLFVTSTDRNELRVLELNEDSEDRDFVRAPNPLEPLAIPVLERPQGLARDVRYVEGEEVAGPFVYARSSGSDEISVIAAEAQHLREVKRLSTGGGPVTAFAGRGPLQEGGRSTLYYATQEAEGGRLWSVELPGPGELLAGAEVPAPVPLDGGGVPLVPAGEAVTAILVLPQPGQIAVATRGSGGLAGQTFRLDVAARAKTPLQFGAPVLQLATHGWVGDSIPEGARIFGILDPAYCGAQPQCTGVLAVDATSGAVALDSTGHPMLPIIGLGRGLPMGLSLSLYTQLLLQEGASRQVQTIGLLGIVPLSNGEILFFDGAALRPFDIDTATADSVVSLLDAQGKSKLPAGETVASLSVEVTDGVTRDRLYALVYQGVLPDLDALPRTPGASGRFEIPSGPAARVQPGDLIVLRPEAGGDPCGTDLAVATVEPPASAGAPAVLVTGTPIPEACASFTRFQVRASGEQPLVLYSTDGFLQRLGIGGAYEEQDRFFFHPPGYGGSEQGRAVRLSVVGLDRGLARDDRYVVATRSRFLPFSIAVDTSLVALSRYRVPGAVVHAEVGPTDYAYIAYPSADGILQVNLEVIFADVPNVRGVTPFE
jgi:hypothetical protein